MKTGAGTQPDSPEVPQVQEHAAPIRASLFVTCIIDQIYPEVGEATTRVLRRLGVDLDFPRGQTCCGQPAFNSGYWRDAKPLARRTLRAFEGDRYVVVPSGSCASMLRVFYAELLEDEPELLARAEALVPRVYEFSEFVVDVLGVTDLGASHPHPDLPPSRGKGQDRPGSPRTVTYHETCHLRRELGASTQARALIGSLDAVTLAEMEQSEVCCGFGGTFSVKYPDISGAMLQDKLDNIRDTGADAVVACDSSCLMHIGGGMARQGMRARPMHLAELMDENMRER